MKTSAERVKPTRVKLTITATVEEMKPALDHAYEHISEQVNIPGFRKGKVPAKILEQRVGRPAIIQHAINDGLDDLYRQAIEAEKIRPLGQPVVDFKELPDPEAWTGNLVIEVEVEARPEFKLPKYKNVKLTVDDAKVGTEEVNAELDRLRERFGTLNAVDRAAKKGDFVSIDLTAAIDGKNIDSAENISYEIGSGKLLDGIDDALDTLTAGETTTFKSKLVGGDLAGTEAEVTVTLNAVQERELPKADDEFAQLASEFDTLAELKDSLKAQLEQAQVYNQGLQARDLLVEELLKAVEIPVSDELIEADVNRHLEGEGRLEDEVHRKEVTEQSSKSFQSQMLLDAIAEAEEVKVTENDLLQYLFMAAQSYGVNPNEFIQQINDAGQMPSYVAEVARRNALGIALETAEVVDSKGKKIDITLYMKPDDVAGVIDEHAGHDHD